MDELHNLLDHKHTHVEQPSSLSNRVSTNLLNEIAQKEGFKNKNDIYDIELDIEPDIESPVHGEFDNQFSEEIELMKSVFKEIVSLKINQTRDDHAHYLLEQDDPRIYLTDEVLNDWLKMNNYQGLGINIEQSIHYLSKDIFKIIENTDSYQKILSAIDNLSKFKSPLSQSINHILKSNNAINKKRELVIDLNKETEQAIINQMLGEIQFSIEPYHIEIILDDSKELSLSDVIKLAQIVEFSERFSVLYQEAFQTILQREHLKSNVVTEGMIEFISEKQHDLPKFTIMQSEQANQWLNKTEFFTKPSDPNFSSDFLEDSQWGLVYNMPTPIAMFWGKCTNIYGLSDRELNAYEYDIIPWGDYYRELTSVAHNAIALQLVSNYPKNQHYGICLDRLNPHCVHNPFSPENTGSNPEAEPVYYYVWKVS